MCIVPLEILLKISLIIRELEILKEQGHCDQLGKVKVTYYNLGKKRLIKTFPDVHLLIKPPSPLYCPSSPVQWHPSVLKWKYLVFLSTGYE